MLELQSTLEELSSRVDGVKEENLRLRSENQVLGQYIENLMTASKVSNLLLKSEKNECLVLVSFSLAGSVDIIF